MKVLLIDTSTSYLYVKIYDAETKQIIYEKTMISHNNHSENIIGVIEEGLDANKMKLKDIQKVIVGQGPGSYTGLRVGMVVAKMTSFSLNIPMYVMSSLQLIGSGYLINDGIYCISSVAKKDYCYGTIIEVKKGKIKVVLPDTFLQNDEFLIKVKEYNGLLINSENYLLNIDIIEKMAIIVKDIHNVVPNYLRLANS